MSGYIAVDIVFDESVYPADNEVSDSVNKALDVAYFINKPLLATIKYLNGNFTIQGYFTKCSDIYDEPADEWGYGYTAQLDNITVYLFKAPGRKWKVFRY